MQGREATQFLQNEIKRKLHHNSQFLLCTCVINTHNATYHRNSTVSNIDDIEFDNSVTCNLSALHAVDSIDPHSGRLYPALKNFS